MVNYFLKVGIIIKDLLLIINDREKENIIIKVEILTMVIGKKVIDKVSALILLLNKMKDMKGSGRMIIKKEKAFIITLQKIKDIKVFTKQIKDKVKESITFLMEIQSIIYM